MKSVGPRGWLGVNLGKGISWKTVARLVREAYEKVAPASLTKSPGKTIEIAPPTAKLKPEDIDPMQSKRAQSVLEELRAICLSLPETSESKQFGNPVWRAGKKVFAQAYCYRSDRKLLKVLDAGASSTESPRGVAPGSAALSSTRVSSGRPGRKSRA